MKWIKLFEEFQLGDLNVMSPEEIRELFFEECDKKIPDLNLIRVILDNGLVDVNAKNKSGSSPLGWAVFSNNVNLVKLLISAGADVNSKTKYGFTPLHYAAYRDNVALAELLISAGADVNAKNKYGESPFELAVRMGNVEMQALLKKHGAVL